MEMNTNFSLSCRIPSELAERAKQVANREGLNLSSLVRQSLKNQIEAYVREYQRGKS
jgi:antitoxin component of RelBE/YafQ-DinJ toxin-antitoxin module